MRHCLTLCAVLFLSICPSTLMAQVAADLRGRVLDPSGATVPNATVELTQSSTKVHLVTTSSGSGDYFFTSLTPGTYQPDVADGQIQDRWLRASDDLPPESLVLKLVAHPTKCLVYWPPNHSENAKYSLK
jgi:Carboxypeptidase regulatory-like domain